MLGEAGVVAVRARERRHLAREVADERGLFDGAFHELLEQLLHDLARPPRLVDVHAVALRDGAQVRAVERDLLAGGLGDRPQDRDAARTAG